MDVNTSTRAVLTRLVHLSVQTGSITAIAAVVDLGLGLGLPGDNSHLVL